MLLILLYLLHGVNCDVLTKYIFLIIELLPKVTLYRLWKNFWISSVVEFNHLTELFTLRCFFSFNTVQHPTLTMLLVGCKRLRNKLVTTSTIFSCSLGNLNISCCLNKKNWKEFNTYYQIIMPIFPATKVFQSNSVRISILDQT